jgi:hypothetical protein
MTPERATEIENYVHRLDLDQLPGWAISDRIIADLWEVLQEKDRELLRVGQELKAAEAKNAAASEWLLEPPIEGLGVAVAQAIAALDPPAQVGEESGGDAEHQDLAQLGDDLELKDGR